MRLITDRKVTRSIGSLIGAGFVALGAYVLFGAAGPLSETVADRALGYGTTAVVVGLIALVASWTVRDPDTIWCSHPRRWGRMWPGQPPGGGRPPPSKHGD